MSSALSSAPLIRDAVSADIMPCLEIDPSYEAGAVWQMAIQLDDANGAEIRFRRERLPRTLILTPTITADDFRAALMSGRCFLVAQERTTGAISGYLLLAETVEYAVGRVQAVAVDPARRNQGIGRRLVSAARIWAREQQLTDLQITLTTKNYPAIAFATAVGFTFCGFNDRLLPGREIAVSFALSLR